MPLRVVRAAIKIVEESLTNEFLSQHNLLTQSISTDSIMALQKSISKAVKGADFVTPSKAFSQNMTNHQTYFTS